MPSAMPLTGAGNVNLAVSVIPGTEPVIPQLITQSAEAARSILLHTDLAVMDSACRMVDMTCSCTFCSNLAPDGPRHLASVTGPSHCSSCTESLEPNVWRDDVHVSTQGSCNGASAEQHVLFSAPQNSVQHGVNKKRERDGFSFPDSLARSFDSADMDKIAKAIVRVNEYGSSTAMNRSKKVQAFSKSCAFMHTTPRVLPSVGAFTVQCAKCFKWRLIPSKEQYEQIRQDILEKPFFCSSWRPGASCDDPPELCEDSKLLWAIDKPNIPSTPNGWKRLLVIRGEGSSKFGDIYYVAPSGKKLRSMPDIERYLFEHPELVNKGVSLSQFSFSTPRALDENYCRKRTASSSTVMRGSVTRRMISTNNPWVSAAVRQPQDEQLLLSCAENAPLAVEPLRAWDPDTNQHVLMIEHQSVELDSSTAVNCV